MTLADVDIAIGFNTVVCCHDGCDAIIAMPVHVMQAFRRNHKWWYCYNGHQQHFSGVSDVERLRRDLDSERKRKEWLQQELKVEKEAHQSTRRSRAIIKGKFKATKTRIKNGVCPCCKRSFQNLHRHMTTKHPDYNKKKKGKR